MSNQEVSRDRDRTRTVDGIARIAEHLFEPTARGTFSLHYTAEPSAITP